MGDFEASVTLPRPRSEVFEYFRRPANLLKMFPGYANTLHSLTYPEVLDEGGQLEFEVRSMGAHFRFVHQIVEIKSFDHFKLSQVQGPFRAWNQEHHFTDTDLGETDLKTIIRFDPPG